MLRSAGSAENLQLRQGKAGLGFVQGGTRDARLGDEEQLESLGMDGAAYGGRQDAYDVLLIQAGGTAKLYQRYAGA